MLVFRLAAARFSACAGEGARIYGGRWNSKGHPVVYTAPTRSLAALEVLVHAATLSEDYIAVPIEISPALPVFEISPSDLADWELSTTRRLGDSWLSRCETAVLRVPSKVIPAESNYLLNPDHPDFRKLEILSFESFRFDERLLERFVGIR